MRRRTLLGLGAAVSGGLAFGTGAFTTVSAQRSVSILTTSGGDAFLTLRPDEENGAFVETDGGTVRVNFAEDGSEAVLYPLGTFRRRRRLPLDG